MKRILFVILSLVTTFTVEAKCYPGLDCPQDLPGGSLPRSEPTNTSGCMSGDCRNGYGVYVYLNGSRYEGDWLNGSRDGQGVYYYNDGSRYQGGWKNDKKEGRGAFYHANGKVIFIDPPN